MTERWRSREELAHRVVTLATQGVAQRAIARSLGVSRNTVKTLLIGHRVERESAHSALQVRPARAPRAQKLDRHKPRVAELIKQFPDITAQRVFEKLRDEGFDGSYTAVKRHLRAVRPPAKPAPSLVTPDYAPGEMAGSHISTYESPLGAVPSHDAWHEMLT